MNPEKGGHSAASGLPCQRAGGALVAATLDRLISILARPPESKPGVVLIESAVEALRRAVLRIQHERAHERASAVAAALENIRQVRDRAAERRAKLVDAVRRRGQGGGGGGMGKGGGRGPRGPARGHHPVPFERVAGGGAAAPPTRQTHPC